jgi:AraC-like DNA-binding protein
MSLGGPVHRKRARTADVDDAQRAMSDFYHAEMDLSAGPQGAFACEMSAFDDGTASVASLRFSGRVRSGTDAFGDVLIAHAVHGRHRWRVGDERGSGAVPFLIPPGCELRVEFSGAHLRTVGFGEEYLRGVAESLTGIPPEPFRFEGVNARRSRPVLAAETLALLEATMLHDNAMPSALLRARVIRQAAVSMLATFPLVDLEPRTDKAIPHRRVRRAVAYMEAHAPEPITVGDIALAASTTTRSLQEAFRHRFDMTPMQFLRRLRLRLAREQLLNGHDLGLTVHDVALRWGFSHSGRFAQQYLAEFGEHPSQTLRR